MAMKLRIRAGGASMVQTAVGSVEFDDAFLLGVNSRAEELRLIALSQKTRGQFECFSFVDMCEDQSGLDTQAVVSPNSAVPSLLLVDIRSWSN